MFLRHLLDLQFLLQMPSFHIKIYLSYYGVYFENVVTVGKPYMYYRIYFLTFFRQFSCSVYLLVRLFLCLFVWCFFVSLSLPLFDCINVCPIVCVSFCRCFMKSLSSSDSMKTNAIINPEIILFGALPTLWRPLPKV